jgi:site-specific DNA-methyltransferase (adenine-specific)
MSASEEKNRAPRNRTLTLTEAEIEQFSEQLITIERAAAPAALIDKIVNQNLFEILARLPAGFVDLLFIDPPYNLTKSFASSSFKECSSAQYLAWLERWLPALLKTLKPQASVYVCGDWRSGAALQLILERHLKVRNRITWEREKGRGAKLNWKNCAEDIWFCTVAEQYTFNIDAVKMKRRVIAPYRVEGKPKDWQASEAGNFRLTHPSNLWTDLTVPYWSMAENTDHPTQKPEKLLAKIILASSRAGELVFDPFLGSGTTVVVAKKLGRHYLGVELDTNYCCLAQKRLLLAERDKSIQGYTDGVFWERNSLREQKKMAADDPLSSRDPADSL